MSKDDRLRDYLERMVAWGQAAAAFGAEVQELLKDDPNFQAGATLQECLPTHQAQELVEKHFGSPEAMQEPRDEELDQYIGELIESGRCPPDVRELVAREPRLAERFGLASVH